MGIFGNLLKIWRKVSGKEISGEEFPETGQAVNEFKASDAAVKNNGDTVVYYDPWYTYGTQDRGKAGIIMHDRVRKIKKVIVDKQGLIQDFPGILHPEVIAPHYTQNMENIKPYVQYRTEMEKKPEGHILIWELQPDGRYWEDEDGFGASSDSEIRLYGRLDDAGNWKGPFQVYNIGVTSFYGTDLEEQYAKEAREKSSKKEQ